MIDQSLDSILRHIRETNQKSLDNFQASDRFITKLVSLHQNVVLVYSCILFNIQKNERLTCG